MKTITIEEVAKNLIGKDVSEITETFEDYTFEGENSVIVTEYQPEGYSLQAYVDHRKAPVICINIDDNDIITEADIHY